MILFKILPSKYNHVLYELCLQVDKGVSPEIVRSVLTERAHLPCLAAKTAYTVSRFSCHPF